MYNVVFTLCVCWVCTGINRDTVICNIYSVYYLSYAIFSVTKDDSTKPKPERQLSDKQKTYSEDSVDGCANAHVISVHGISQNGDFSKEDHVHNGDVEERMEEVQSKTDCLSIRSAVEENIDNACKYFE